jgi:hypothetical protein
MSLSVGVSSSKGVQSPGLPSFDDIDTLTLSQIESARWSASFFDEELAPVTTALILDSAPIKRDDAVEIAKLKTELLTAPRTDRKSAAQQGDVRAEWKRLERRDSYSSPWQPACLQQLIGDEYFQEVTSVSFHGETTDDQLTAIEDLDRIVDLNRGDAKKSTDGGLAHVAVGRYISLGIANTGCGPTLQNEGLRPFFGTGPQRGRGRPTVAVDLASAMA